MTANALGLQPFYQCVMGDMAEMQHSIVPELVSRCGDAIREAWMSDLLRAGALRSGQIREAKLGEQCTKFFADFTRALQVDLDVATSAWDEVRDGLAAVSRERAMAGFTPSETATFVFSLKQPLFAFLQTELGSDAEGFAREVWRVTTILDKLGLFTTDAFLKSRESIIARQQSEMVELSTPVVRLWDGIVAIPLIGTLDSERTQTVMETLLQAILDEEAEIAILDITGVPTVDTLVAQHLMRTVAAARLMGADCIISGIRPQIAQTIVHLGLDLGVVSKATLADALELALRRCNKAVRPIAPKAGEI